MAIVKVVRKKSEEELRADYVAAMWLQFLRCPSTAAPDVDGFYDLQEIGETKSDRGVLRDTPYSIAKGIR